MQIKLRQGFNSLLILLNFLPLISCNSSSDKAWDLDKKNSGQKTFKVYCNSCHSGVNTEMPMVFTTDLQDFKRKMDTLSANGFLHRKLIEKSSEKQVKELIYYIKYKKSNQVVM